MSYNGLCVGGPADGMMISQKGTLFRATRRVDASPVGPDDGRRGSATRVTEYKWLSLNKQVSLWTPVGQSLDETMLMLATHYKPENTNVG